MVGAQSRPSDDGDVPGGAWDGELPDLSEALDNLERDEVVTEALGEHILSHFLEAKRAEWAEYISRVQPWEVDKYLEAY